MVLQPCYNCKQTTEHDIYSTCLRCRKYNQEKKSPADYEREREAERRAKEVNSYDLGSDHYSY